MAQGRAKRLGGWIPAAAALVAMAAFAAAVPVHHSHMLAASMAQPAKSSEQLSPHRDHAHRHDGHAHGHHHAASTGEEKSPAGTDHGEHDMPPCPVCSLAQAGKAPIAPAGPFLAVLAREYHTERPQAETVAAAPSFHFRPVQPRAPPIVS